MNSTLLGQESCLFWRISAEFRRIKTGTSAGDLGDLATEIEAIIMYTESPSLRKQAIALRCEIESQSTARQLA